MSESRSMFPLTRRAFATATSRALCLTAIPRVRRSMSWRDDTGVDSLSRTNAVVPADMLATLAQHAVDAARSAGATYAEARLTRDISQIVGARQLVSEDESHGIGVRGLANGAWGFPASPSWTVDEAAQLGKDATAQARENARVVTDPVELVPASPAVGTWTTPLRLDPFAIPVEEKIDLVRSMDYTPPFLRPGWAYAPSASSGSVWCGRQERVVATSEGALFTQLLYTSGARLYGQARIDWGATVPTGMHMAVQQASREVNGAGWETVLDAKFPTLGPALAQEAFDAMALAQLTPVRAVEVGYHTVVFDAATIQAIVAVVFGAGLDLDRITGMEINAGGASYVGDTPSALMERYDYHCPQLTVNATPSGGRKWDDEGVEPVPFPVITGGILQDFATTRSSTALLAASYQKRGRSLRSHGCATAGQWSTPVIGGGADLVIAPGQDAVGLDDLVASVPRGLVVAGGSVSSDWEGRELAITGTVRQIVNGRLGAFVGNAVVRVSATELWKNLIALGGARSAVSGAQSWRKGQPEQSVGIRVTAVPAAFSHLPVTNAVGRG